MTSHALSGADGGHTDRVAHGQRRLEVGGRVAVEGLEHATDHASVDRADHGMFDGRTTEGAVLGNDAQLMAVLFGVRCETVGCERVGHGVKRRPNRQLGSVFGSHRLGHGPSVFAAYLLGESLGCVGAEQAERLAEKGNEDVMVANLDFEAHLGVADAVALRGPPRSSGLRLGYFEVACAGQLIEVVASDVGVEVESGSRFGSGDAVFTLVCIEIDVAPGGIAESRRDGGNRRSELRWSEGHPVHVGTLPNVPITEDFVIDVLRPVEDPELHRSIVDLDMVRTITIEGSSVSVQIALTIAGCPLRAEIDNRVNSALASLDGVATTSVTFTVMTDEERAALAQRLNGDPAASAGSQPAHGHAEGRAIPFADPSSATRCLLIASGKGGVGKSSITTNLAVALADMGKKVAVVDADVWGFSIPRMLGVDRPPVVIDEMLVPPEVHGVRCISMGFFAEEDQPVIWRGPMLHKALEQFLTDVYWDDPDYLLVDLPPGTGDISLSLAQFLPRGEVYVVTTPQPAAQKVAQRAAFMAHKVNLEVKGVIENMSWFTGDDGKRYELFGSGGGAELADLLDVDLLGRVPLVPQLREGADTGRPLVHTDPASEAAVVFAEIAKTIEVDLAPTRRYNPELKII